jgi:hypothetical protein
MAYLNLTGKKLMNIGGDEYKRDEYGNWFSKERVTYKVTTFVKWVKCTHENSRFLSWVAANENN